MPGTRPVARGALYPLRRAPTIDSGTTLAAIATVLAAILLYTLVWWVLGADDDDDVLGAAARAAATASADPTAVPRRSLSPLRA